jgi:hypothetical protein
LATFSTVVRAARRGLDVAAGRYLGQHGGDAAALTALSRASRLLFQLPAGPIVIVGHHRPSPPLSYFSQRFFREFFGARNVAYPWELRLTLGSGISKHSR